MIEEWRPVTDAPDYEVSSDDQVREIHSMASDGVRQTCIAERLGVSQSSVSYAIRKRVPCAA